MTQRVQVALVTVVSILIVVTSGCSSDGDSKAPDTGAPDARASDAWTVDLPDASDAGSPDQGTDTRVVDLGSDSADHGPTDGQSSDASDAGDIGADAAPDTTGHDITADQVADIGTTGQTCAMPRALTLAAGRATVSVDTSSYPFLGRSLSCRHTDTTTTFSVNAFSRVAWFSFVPTQNTWYRIRVQAAYEAYVSVFTTSSCAKADLETDCQSNGVTGAGGPPILANSSRTVYYRASTTAPVKIAVAGSALSTSNGGALQVDVESITATPTNGTCANAKLITLTNGVGTAAGETAPGLTADEFSGLNCSVIGSGLNVRTFKGPQAYYRFNGTQGRVYRLTVKGDFTKHVFLARTTTCTEAGIETACQSAGNVDGGSHHGSRGDVILDWRASSTGSVLIGIDAHLGYEYGEFTIEVRDLGPVAANAKCAGATTLMLTNGSATASGRTSFFYTPDEFPRVNCRFIGGPVSTTWLDGPQVYYKFAAMANTWYKISAQVQFIGHLYVFRSPTCTEASIDTDCQSTNTVDGGLLGPINQGATESMYYQAPANGDIYVAIDSAFPNSSGGYKLDVKIAAPPTNGTCANAQALTFANGTVSVQGWMGPKTTPNEFPAIRCNGPGVTRPMVGPQAYYAFTSKPGKVYRITLAPADVTAGIHAYVFGAGCTAANIDTECDGNIGRGTIRTPVSFTYQPAAVGLQHVAVDSTSSGAFGGFRLTIDEL